MENLENMTPEERAEYWKKKAEGNSEPKEKAIEEKKRPTMTNWIPLGENFGISVAVWDNGVTLTKRKKENNQWIDGEKFNLSHTVLERIFVRVPAWFAMTEKKE